MKTEQVSPSDIYATALQVFSPEELQQMPKQQQLSLATMLERRLAQESAPSKEELEGLKELLLNDLWHPALSALPKTSQPSPTTKPETSESQQPTEMPSPEASSQEASSTRLESLKSQLPQDVQKFLEEKLPSVLADLPNQPEAGSTPSA